MYWFYFSSLILVALIVLYLLWYYPNAQTTPLVRLIVGLAWFISLSVMILVPEDVIRALSAAEKQHDIARVSEGVLNAFWVAVYWTTIAFILLVLPFLQKYSDSGDFTVRDRCVYALRRSVQLLAIVFGVLVSGFLVLLLADRKVTFRKFVGWLMAVLNAYGLIGAMCLMGYGLVDIPRKLWQRANHLQRQNFLFQTAGMRLERATAAHLELSKQINSVRRFDGQFTQTDQMRPYMDVIVKMLSRVPDFDPQETEEDDDDVNVETDTPQGLGVLRQRLRKSIDGYYREREYYLSLVREYLSLHETLQNEDRKGMPFVYADGRQVSAMVGYWVWGWRCRILPLLQRLLAVIGVVLSVLIVVAEVSIAKYLPNVSVFSQILLAVKSRSTAVIIFTFLFLFYVMACMYYTLIRLGRFSFYLLVPKHTAPFSLASNALLLCRFVIPLCFNFLTAVALPIKNDKNSYVEDTQFWDSVGERISDMPLLGKLFTTYIPILLLPYVLLIAFNGINRVMSVLDPKRKFAFKDDWDLDMDSNYASTGRQVMNLEVEYFQKGWEPGLTIVEGTRMVMTPSAAATGRQTPFMEGKRTSSNPWAKEGSSRAARPGARTGTHSANPHDIQESSPFFRRTSSLEVGTTSTNPPAVPIAHMPRRSNPDMRNVPSDPPPLGREGTDAGTVTPRTLAQRLGFVKGTQPRD